MGRRGIMSKAEWLEKLCISEVNLVHRYIATAEKYPMKNNGRAHCGFLYTVEGNEIYHFYDGDICVFPNSVTFIPKGEQYSIDFCGERGDVICFDFELADAALLRPFTVSMESDPSAAFSFFDAERKWNSRRRESFPECKACFYKIVSSLVKTETGESGVSENTRLREALSFLRAHCTDPELKISQIAWRFEMSTRYFEMLFLKNYQVTPKEYITILRLELAKELLLSEKLSVTETAYQLGYSDIYHFSKIFKKKTGYTPSAYKRIHLGKK